MSSEKGGARRRGALSALIAVLLLVVGAFTYMACQKTVTPATFTRTGLRMTTVIVTPGLKLN
ncbi:MAG: hypothetical protein QXU52_00530 [Fervidicoccaceae archaeon]